MGKAQSKRSMDITTDIAKDGVESPPGKLEKIEDVDQLKSQSNGGANHTEGDNMDKEKKLENDAAENEKDITAEKENKTDNNEQSTNAEDASAPTPTATSPTAENGNSSADDTLNDSNKVEETTINDSGKKPKKEKVKKKWSFRSISFSKKDKQKPVKKDDKEAKTNGEIENVPEESPAEDAAAATVETKSDAPVAVVEESAKQSDEKVPEKSEPAAAPAEVKAAEPTPAPVVEAAPAAVAPVAVVEEVKAAEPIVEEKKAEVVENVVVEQTPAEPLAVPAPVVEEQSVVVEEKNEVKEEQTQKIEEPETKVEVKIDEVQQQSAEPNVVSEPNVVVVDETKTIIENGDSYPPPPLPSLPPPSPVMVFAESAMSSNTNENTDTILVDKLQNINENSSISLTTAPAVEAIEAPSATVDEKQENSVVVDANIESLALAAEPLPPSPIPNESELAPAPEPLAPIVTETIEAVIETKSDDLPPPPPLEIAAEEPQVNQVVEELKQDVSEVVEDILEKAVDKIVSEVSIKEDAAAAAAAVTAATVAEVAAAPIENANEDIKPEQIEATIALIDNVVTSETNSASVLPPPPPLALAPLDDISNIPTTIDDLPLPSPIDNSADPKDLSEDISSPLPQNSLESLPSPPTLSPSEVSLPQSPIETSIITENVIESITSNTNNNTNTNNNNTNDDENNVVAPTTATTDIIDTNSNIEVANTIIPENVSANNNAINENNIIVGSGDNLEQPDKINLTDKHASETNGTVENGHNNDETPVEKQLNGKAEDHIADVVDDLKSEKLAAATPQIAQAEIIAE